jgi:hypothetical protein
VCGRLALTEQLKQAVSCVSVPVWEVESKPLQTRGRHLQQQRRLTGNAGSKVG